MHSDIRPDVVVGADIVCRSQTIAIFFLIFPGQVLDPSLIPALVGVLKHILKGAHGDRPGNERFALIALTHRNEATINTFVTQIRGKSK